MYLFQVKENRLYQWEKHICKEWWRPYITFSFLLQAYKEICVVFVGVLLFVCLWGGALVGWLVLVVAGGVSWWVVGFFFSLRRWSYKNIVWVFLSFFFFFSSVLFLFPLLLLSPLLSFFLVSSSTTIQCYWDRLRAGTWFCFGCCDTVKHKGRNPEDWIIQTGL